MDLEQIRDEIQDAILEEVEVTSEPYNDKDFVTVSIKRFAALCVEPERYEGEGGLQRLRYEAQGLQRSLSRASVLPSYPGYTGRVCEVNRDAGIVTIDQGMGTPRESFRLDNPADITRFEVGMDEGCVRWFLGWQERKREDAK